MLLSLSLLLSLSFFSLSLFLSLCVCVCVSVCVCVWCCVWTKRRVVGTRLLSSHICVIARFLQRPPFSFPRCVSHSTRRLFLATGRDSEALLILISLSHPD